MGKNLISSLLVTGALLTGCSYSPEVKVAHFQPTLEEKDYKLVGKVVSKACQRNEVVFTIETDYGRKGILYRDDFLNSANVKALDLMVSDTNLLFEINLNPSLSENSRKKFPSETFYYISCIDDVKPK